eukprot:UN05091
MLFDNYLKDVQMNNEDIVCGACVESNPDVSNSFADCSPSLTMKTQEMKENGSIISCRPNDGDHENESIVSMSNNTERERDHLATSTATLQLNNKMKIICDYKENYGGKDKTLSHVNEDSVTAESIQ